MSAGKIQEFFNKQFGTITTVQQDEKVWFVGVDIAKALGYENTRDAVSKRVFDIYKLRMQIAYAGQNRTVTLINEAGGLPAYI